MHHIPNGEEWTISKILKRKKTIEDNGLSWSVVKSIPVHESIKKCIENFKEYIKNYKKGIKNLANCGIHIICYNFMPMLDWTRTDLAFKVEDESKALQYDAIAFAAFELYLLKRLGASNIYSEEIKNEAKKTRR